MRALATPYVQPSTNAPRIPVERARSADLSNSFWKTRSKAMERMPRIFEIACRMRCQHLKQRESYVATCLVVVLRNALSRTFIPNLAFGHKIGLYRHRQCENRRDGKSNQGQLPALHQSPDQAHAEHGKNDE